MINNSNLNKKLILKNEQEIRVIYIDNLFAITLQDYLCTFFYDKDNSFI